MKFEDLITAATACDSGEFIIAGANLETHVYLCAGRLAWATSSHTAAPFIRSLRDNGIASDAIADVLAECRRSGARLVDTLIDWGVATTWQVRQAQLAQVCEALATLIDAGDVQTIFLRRDLKYDPAQTFSLEEVAAACSGHLSPVRAALTAAGVQPCPPRAPGSIRFEDPKQTPTNDRRLRMANAKESLPKLMDIDGCLGACIVDSNSGMMLGATGGGPVDLEIAAAGNTEVVRAKRKTMNSLKLNETIEDILITLGNQYHVIRPLQSNPALFIYLVLDKTKSNLAMARIQLRGVEKELTI